MHSSSFPPIVPLLLSLAWATKQVVPWLHHLKEDEARRGYRSLGLSVSRSVGPWAPTLGRERHRGEKTYFGNDILSWLWQYGWRRSIICQSIRNVGSNPWSLVIACSCKTNDLLYEEERRKPGKTFLPAQSDFSLSAPPLCHTRLGKRSLSLSSPLTPLTPVPSS